MTGEFAVILDKRSTRVVLASGRSPALHCRPYQDMLDPDARPMMRMKKAGTPADGKRLFAIHLLSQ
jgi:hypothetical protein